MENWGFIFGESLPSKSGLLSISLGGPFWQSPIDKPIRVKASKNVTPPHIIALLYTKPSNERNLSRIF